MINKFLSTCQFLIWKNQMKFYIEIGFTINAEFTGENQKCVVWSEHIFVMLQSQKMFQSFIKKQIPDPKKYQSFILHTSCKKFRNG